MRGWRLRPGHDHRRLTQGTINLLTGPGIIGLNGLFAGRTVENNFSHNINSICQTRPVIFPKQGGRW
jgi:hypothetical protein